MEINNEGMPYPALWGNKLAYVPFSAGTFVLLMFGSLLTQLWNQFGFGVWWNIFLALATDTYADFTFMEKVLKFFSDWISSWAFHIAIISGLSQGFNSHATAAVLHASTFWISVIFYLMYGDIYKQIDFEPLLDDKDTRLSVTYGTVYHYIQKE